MYILYLFSGADDLDISSEYTIVKDKHRNDNKDKSKSHNKSKKHSKMDTSVKSKKYPISIVKKELDNPASPIKSYLSGESTPPRKLSVESPCSSSLDSFTDKLTDSDCSNLSGVKRKYSSDLSTLRELSEPLLKTQRKDSNDSGIGECLFTHQQKDTNDSGLESSRNSFNGTVNDKNKFCRKSEELFSTPLDDLLGGSILPFLPETTKAQERGKKTCTEILCVCALVSHSFFLKKIALEHILHCYTLFDYTSTQ